jgi:hypothetical protein
VVAQGYIVDIGGTKNLENQTCAGAADQHLALIALAVDLG